MNNGDIILSDTNINFSNENSKQISFSGNTGQVSVFSNDISIVTASLIGNNINLQKINDGNSTIEVNVASTQNSRSLSKLLFVSSSGNSSGNTPIIIGDVISLFKGSDQNQTISGSWIPFNQKTGHQSGENIDYNIIGIENNSNMWVKFSSGYRGQIASQSSNNYTYTENCFYYSQKTFQEIFNSIGSSWYDYDFLYIDYESNAVDKYAEVWIALYRPENDFFRKCVSTSTFNTNGNRTTIKFRLSELMYQNGYDYDYNNSFAFGLHGDCGAYQDWSLEPGDTYIKVYNIWLAKE